MSSLVSSKTVLLVAGSLAAYFLLGRSTPAATVDNGGLAPADNSIDPSIGEEIPPELGVPRVALTDTQKQMVGIIDTAADVENLDPSFMVALAVTESSLRAGIVGDDGISVGLFQLQVATAKAYQAGITLEDLTDAETNAAIAAQYMRHIINSFPGHTFGDYAEAWTLGPAGRFNRNLRNPGKVANMNKAVADLGLSISMGDLAS